MTPKLTSHKIIHAKTQGRKEVAQSCTLPYRGFSIRKSLDSSSAWAGSEPPPNAIRRYGRLKICATREPQWLRLLFVGVVILLAGATALLPTVTLAQGAIEAWVQRYNGQGNGDDSIGSIAVDAAGNVVVTGVSAPGPNSESVTIKYSSWGAPLWTNVCTGSGNAVAVDTNGNVFVAGSSRDAQTGNDRCTTVKYSTAGLPLWTNRYTAPGYAMSFGRFIAVNGSDNLYVTGLSQGNGSITGFTIKYSSEGAQLWARTHNASSQAAALDVAGNLYVTGVAANYSDYATIKYSSTGALLWSRLFQAQGMPFALAVGASGNVVVAGRSGGPNGNDFLTLMYSGAGVLLWTNRFGGPGMDEDDASAVAVDASGNVLVAGSTWRSGTQADYAILKYSSTGVPLWTNFYNGPANGSENAWALALDASRNVYVTGGSDGGGSGWDYATVAYSSAGMRLWAKRYNAPENNRDEARRLVVDASGNVFVAGFSTGGGSGFDFATIKYVIPPIITRQPVGRTNAVGTTGSFDVEVAGSAPFSYHWLKGGLKLLDGGFVSGVTTTNLVIADVQPADAGDYTVVVTNAYGSATSHVAQLTVVVPPSAGRFTSFSYSAGTGFTFIFRDGTVGKLYRIQRSSSLAEGSWADWQSFTYSEPTGFLDVSATGAERRFYRVVSP